LGGKRKAAGAIKGKNIGLFSLKAQTFNVIRKGGVQDKGWEGD